LLPNWGNLECLAYKKDITSATALIFSRNKEATYAILAGFTGTFKGPMKGLDGQMIQPTNKKFQTEFCTVATWKDGKITEERLFYDLLES
jgi:ketosteroid isomerase-like protein